MANWRKNGAFWGLKILDLAHSMASFSALGGDIFFLGGLNRSLVWGRFFPLFSALLYGDVVCFGISLCAEIALLYGGVCFSIS